MYFIDKNNFSNDLRTRITSVPLTKLSFRCYVEFYGDGSSREILMYTAPINSRACFIRITLTESDNAANDNLLQQSTLIIVIKTRLLQLEFGTARRSLLSRNDCLEFLHNEHFARADNLSESRRIRRKTPVARNRTH